MFNNVDAWNSVTLTFNNGVTTSFQSACDRTAGTETHNAAIYGTKGFITTENFFMAQNAELHIFTNEWGNDNEITETADLPFGINGYEYELIHATECILNGKTESDVHTNEKSIELCKLMDQLRADWNFKYPFEK